MAHRRLADLELPVATGMRVMAIRRDRDWIIDVDGDDRAPARRRAVPRGPADGIDRLCASWPGRRRGSRPQPAEDPALTDLDRAVDTLVEMKNLSRGRGRAGLLGARAGRPGPRRRGAPSRGPARRDEGPARALGAAGRGRGHRPVAAAGPAPPLPGGRGHRRPGPADGVVDRAATRTSTRSSGSRSASPTRSSCECPWPPARRPTVRKLVRLQLQTSSRASPCWPSAGAAGTCTGPGASSRLEAGDELIACGPDEGRPMLAERCGYRLVRDEETGEVELAPLRAGAAHR